MGLPNHCPNYRWQTFSINFSFVDNHISPVLILCKLSPFDDSHRQISLCNPGDLSLSLVKIKLTECHKCTTLNKKSYFFSLRAIQSWFYIPSFLCYTWKIPKLSWYRCHSIDHQSIINKINIMLASSIKLKSWNNLPFNKTLILFVKPYLTFRTKPKRKNMKVLNIRYAQKLFCGANHYIKQTKHNRPICSVNNLSCPNI